MVINVLLFLRIPHLHLGHLHLGHLHLGAKPTLGEVQLQTQLPDVKGKISLDVEKASFCLQRLRHKFDSTLLLRSLEKEWR